MTYKTYVKYDSSLGAEHIEQPMIEPEQLVKFTNEEFIKDVFRDKRIQVEITIEKTGEVTGAKALNGHEILQEISVKAAQKTLFSARRQPKKATLTYIFILE